MKTALRPAKYDERDGNVVSTDKNAVFKSILRPYQILTASNTFPLISYQARFMSSGSY